MALTGTARTSVGPRPANITLQPSLCTAPLAVLHNDGILFLRTCTSPTLSLPSLAPAVLPLAPATPSQLVPCMRVLKTSTGNVAIHATTPASPPAVISSQALSWESSLSASSMRDS